jgi:hypothetical protein
LSNCIRPRLAVFRKGSGEPARNDILRGARSLFKHPTSCGRSQWVVSEPGACLSRSRFQPKTGRSASSQLLTWSDPLQEHRDGPTPRAPTPVTGLRRKAPQATAHRQPAPSISVLKQARPDCGGWDVAERVRFEPTPSVSGQTICGDAAEQPYC